MPFKRPTYSELDQRIYLDIATRIARPDQRGTEWTRAALLRKEKTVTGVLARAYAGSCHLLYGYLDDLAKQRFVHLMDSEFLDAEGMAYDIPRKSPDYAHGHVLVHGSDGAIVPSGKMYQSAAGIQYKATASAMVTAGYAHVSIRAVAAGAAGNLAAGAALRASLVTEGLQSAAMVDADGLYGGVDSESDDAYRERILERKRQPPHGGAKHDYVAWAKEVPGVTRAWCMPLWMGMGTVGVMFMRDNDAAPFPNAKQCREVWEYIEEVRPVCATEIYVFSPAKHEFDVVVKLSPDTAAIRTAVKNEVDDFVYRDGEPDGYIRLSRLGEAISSATGEHHHDLIEPSSDLHIPKNALPVAKVLFMGTPEGE